MSRTVLLVAVSLAVACGGTDEEVVPVEDGAQVDESDFVAAEPDTVLPPMPDYPGQRSGYLTAHSVGSKEFEMEWPARAVRCNEPAMLFLIAELERSGASVLLQLPAGDPIGEYPVQFSESGPPEAPASQLGFQFFDDIPSAYQATDGAVQVYGLASSVSGRFTATIRHIVNDARARVAGVFHNVDLEEPPADWCERAAAASDSLAETP